MTKTSPLIRYCLTSDDDGHHWVIPVARRAEWDALTIAELEEKGNPDWAVRIDGPHTLSFADWSESDGDVDTTYAAPVVAPTPRIVSLESLVGPHLLKGVDTPAPNDHKLTDWIRFQLDDKVYVATEDQEDGWRSSMESLVETDAKVAHTFRGVRVIARMVDDRYRNVLELVHTKTGKVVLCCGTDERDSYYPCWVAEWTEANLKT